MGKLLWEILERAMTGPVMKEDEFETEFFPKKIKEIIAEHGIKYDPENPIMTDPSMADEIFQAGIELLTEVGLYCKDTKRIVKFDEGEIKEVIKTRKTEVTLGIGRDRFTISPRGPEDKKPPKTFYMAGWMGSDLKVWKDAALMSALEPTADGLVPSILEGIYDLRPTTGTPTESLLVQTEARIMREVAARAGRPGMWLGIPMNASHPIALMSAFGPGLYNRYNCMMPVHILQDMRINFDRLNLAYFAMQHGIIPWISSCPTMYAYIGGPEEAAVEGIAHTLGMMAFSDGSFTQAMSMTIQSRYDGRECFWANSAMALAAERHLKVPWISSGLGAWPVASENMMYGAACACIVACVSGMEGMWMVGGLSALDQRFAGEFTRAVAGIKVSEGLALIKEILKKYEDKVPATPEMTLPDFYELYDKKTLKPNSKYLELYKRITREFKDMGFDYPTWE